MIDLIIDKANVNSPDSKTSPLFWTIFKHQFKLAKKLIELGADTSQRNLSESNLLHILFSNFDGDLELAPVIADLIL